MDRAAVRALLEALSSGRMSVDDALGRLRSLPYEDLGFAKVDQHRGLRAAAVEAIFCQGKTPEQVVAIAQRLAAHASNVIATRADAGVAAAVAAAGLAHAYHAAARLIIVRPTPSDAKPRRSRRARMAASPATASAAGQRS